MDPWFASNLGRRTKTWMLFLRVKATIYFAPLYYLWHYGTRILLRKIAECTLKQVTSTKIVNVLAITFVVWKNVFEASTWSNKKLVVRHLKAAHKNLEASLVLKASPLSHPPLNSKTACHLLNIAVCKCQAWTRQLHALVNSQLHWQPSSSVSGCIGLRKLYPSQSLPFLKGSMGRLLDTAGCWIHDASSYFYLLL